MTVGRSWLYEPCPSVTGVKHDGCDYLAHIICTKCGWIEPDHRCVAHYGTLTPDTRLQAITDVPRCEHELIDRHQAYILNSDLTQKYHPNGVAVWEWCEGAPELRVLLDVLAEEDTE